MKITAHALKRWGQRSSKLTILSKELRDAIHLEGEIYYKAGLIFIIREEKVITIIQPTGKYLEILKNYQHKIPKTIEEKKIEPTPKIKSRKFDKKLKGLNLSL